ncbi:MAG: hypothetical protein ABSA97_09530 [Verrucomicrobiia bacterium]
MKVLCWRKLAFFIWPPYEACFANHVLDKKAHKDGWETSLAEIRAVIPEGVDEGALDALAKCVQDSESARKDTLEDKATSFFSEIGVTISIITIVPTLFAGDWKLSGFWAYVASIAYLVGLISLLMAAYYGVKVRRCEAFALPSAESFLVLLKAAGKVKREGVVVTIAQAKWNEASLLRKSNFLTVAEAMFLRGLAFVALAAVTSIGAKLFLSAHQ